ncbi:J domain-containing protein [Nocardioides sp.]|uniref:J domain-containing protein n=1 Tax=Nocardioides sp. TaxID=35761 RepID=UPI002B678CEC|nr:DnaJ domain-containing protein [Nocardioides sp.]HXH79199.1 DnaJ domain-containing protein [Nocardioides sp.]
MNPSWYDVLDIEPTASHDEVRAAWRAGIADLEPGSRRFQRLNEAAEVLLDKDRRAAYDAELAAQRPEPVLAPTPDASSDARSDVRSGDKSVGSTEGEHDAGATATRPEPRRVVPLWLIAAVALVTLAAVAVAAFAWSRPQDRLETPSLEAISIPNASEVAAREAQIAAEQAIVPVLSYDYRTLEADQKRATAYLTGDYRKSYDELFGVIADNAPSTKTQVSAEVIASGIVRSGEERVDVLIFVDRPTVNKLSAQPVLSKDQVTVTMQKVGDEWLVDNLVTSPAAP